MEALNGVIGCYTAIVVGAGGLSVILSARHILRLWSALPTDSWGAKSLGLGILILLTASAIEAPFLILMPVLSLAFAAGIFEEGLKLIPAWIFRNAPAWKRWKLVVGAGFFLGLVEGTLYTAGILALGEPTYLIGVRVVLVGFHTAWAAISAGFFLGDRGARRFLGLAFSMTAHTLYDLPTLASGQLNGPDLVLIVGLSTLMMVTTPLMVKKATEKMRTAGKGTIASP